MKRHFTPARQHLTDLILRISLAFAFVYAALLGYLHPFDWIGYFPNFIREHFSDSVVLNLFGLSELIIAAWFLWGRKLFIPSVVASLYLFGSLIFNFHQFDVLFRNVPILGISLSLCVLSYPRFIHKNRLE
ncbi:MAG TPA: hypothetical protein VFA52_00170 [Candidatus Paceibacterota bacterium]|nr:hypothetical protein [Candidatus Paceibacterota bacterium]